MGWNYLFQVLDLFYSILSYLPLENIVHSCDLVCKGWHRTISFDDNGISPWPSFYKSFFVYLTNITPTCKVFQREELLRILDANQDENLEIDEEHIFTIQDFECRNNMRMQLLSQIKNAVAAPFDLRSKQQAMLIASNYIFSLRYCNIVREGERYYSEPIWAHSMTNIHVTIPHFLSQKGDTTMAKRSAFMWCEISCLTWFLNTISDIIIDSVLLTKRKNKIWTLIHTRGRNTEKVIKHPQKKQGTKQSVDIRTEWSFVSSRAKTVEYSKVVKPAEDEEEEDEDEEYISTDVWSNIKKKKALNKRKQYVTTYEGKLKVLWIPAKSFRSERFLTEFDQHSLEEAPKKLTKEMNALVVDWIVKLEKLRLLKVDFILHHAMRILYFLHTGHVEGKITEVACLQFQTPNQAEKLLQKHQLKNVKEWKQCIKQQVTGSETVLYFAYLFSLEDAKAITLLNLSINDQHGYELKKFQF
ncbi:hypothetical protein FDP41_001303 [Naegleria fowleri]|uniref:F-box domain-containing protein n=1 Tax=Naegleria fowleri TaxID=5763 RepID=A0A6A5C292_NAEFO|nr:uncharacterized protein FDP41_001303 [Naegleria fowleri]KAF0979635.1 hypothetical protein FDP41_001303 [Naegleria fowleri]CAG4719629.1 unnamed protein product [Naegleria fowleri]